MFAGVNRIIIASTSSRDSSISTREMENVLESLKSVKNCKGTRDNYIRIWRNFNDFIIRLDKKLAQWEDRMSLFLAYLVKKGAKSATIKSYKSAIKSILTDDGYNWSDHKIMLNVLTKACKVQNDVVLTRLPIKHKLLELILFEIGRLLKNQPYLEIMYKAMFALSYYGMLRIGEVTESQHAIQARNVHVAQNKEKILLVLYTSKTHDKSHRPQKIKINANGKGSKFFCSFHLMRWYMRLQGGYRNEKEQLFIYHDYTPVKAEQARKMLKTCLKNLGLDHTLYNFHSIRGGKATSLMEAGYSLQFIKSAGRWRSKSVYKYLKS